MAASGGPRPLDGVRVLELGQLVAGPFAGTILGYFGAEVIKVEPPEGDPIRSWRGLDDGTSLWWRSLARNKRCIAIDLRSERGRELARALALQSDVLIESFRPGTLEKWGLDPELLRREKPGLIVVRVSGFGQTGPYAARPGYASVCEAIGGLRHLTGMPGEPPVRANLSLGDTLAGLHAALGTLLALLQRDRAGKGQVVDAAIYEAVFNTLEAVIPEADRLGSVRGPSGTTITGVVPTGSYPCADGRPVVIGANGESVFRRLCEAMGRSDLAADATLAGNAARVARQDELDRAIADWTRTLPSLEVEQRLTAAAVPCGRVYDARMMLDDPHFQARGLFETVEANGQLCLPALAPKLGDTPGRSDWAGPALGAHTRAVLGERLGLDAAALDELFARKVIA